MPKKIDSYTKKKLGIKEGPLEKTLIKITSELVENPVIQAKFREMRKEFTVKSKYYYVGKAFVMGVLMYYLGGRLEVEDVYSLRDVRLKAAKIFAEAVLKNKILRDLIYSWNRHVAPKSLHPKKGTVIRSPEDLDYDALYIYFRRSTDFDKYESIGFMTIELQGNKAILENTPLCNEIVLEYLPEITKIYDEDLVADLVKEHSRAMYTLEAVGIKPEKEEKIGNNNIAENLNKEREDQEEDVENE
ncbi:MAG: hypothetical protein QXW71_00870 [Thermoplasmata archaeon]